MVAETSKDFPYIRKWGQMLGSGRSYVEDQVALARKDGAPSHATYRKQDGTWSTIDEVTRQSTRAFLGLDTPAVCPDCEGYGDPDPDGCSRCGKRGFRG